MYGAMFLVARAITERAEENFPSTAYGPYLEAIGSCHENLALAEGKPGT
jgi:hypothetical protein